MTSELLEATLAKGVYDRSVPAGVTVCWSGSVKNIQFDIMRRGDVVFVVFAGTNEWADAWRHIWVRREKIADGVLVHRGWLADFKRCMPVMYAVLREQMQNISERVVFIGHSYGGALAQLAAWHYSGEVGMPRVYLRTYGSPRVGNKNFADDICKRTNSFYRYEIQGDPVTQTPLAIRYKHGGTQMKMPFRRSPHAMASYLKSINGE